MHSLSRSGFALGEDYRIRIAQGAYTVFMCHFRLNSV